MSTLRPAFDLLRHALAEIEGRFPPLSHDSRGRTEREQFCYETARLALEAIDVPSSPTHVGEGAV